MKRSRTRRIVSLFMVLTGILMVFSGFLQDAGMPASVAQEPAAAAGEWPRCISGCTANDVEINSIWLEIPASCTPGDPVTAPLSMNLYFHRQNTYCIVIVADLHEDGVLVESDWTSNILPYHSGSGEHNYNMGTVSLTCGKTFEMKNVLVMWLQNDPGSAGCSGTCTDYTTPSKCTKYENIIVTTPLVADFEWTSACEGTSVLFTGSASGGVEPYNYSWDFDDDGLEDSSSNPSNYTFAGLGPYTVNLTVTDSGIGADQQTDSHTAQVTLYANPTVDAANSGPVCVGGTLTLTGGPDGMSFYSWSGPNSFSSSDQSPTVSSSATLAMAGIYTLTVTDANGCTDDETTTVVVNDNPVATAANDGPVCVGGTLTLTGGPSGMDSYSWTGPNSFSSSDQSPTVSSSATLAMAGLYTLSVTDANSCTDEATTTVVVNAKPVATAHNSGPVCLGGTLTLTGGPAGMSSYSWSGPNSFSSSDQSPTVSSSATLAMAGTYTLTVIDSNGCTDQAETTVVVNPSPVASFTAAPGGEPLKVQFNDTSSGSIVAWSWVFGDGGTSTDQNPSHLYAAAGSYTVILTVTDANGCTDSTTAQITVAADLVIGFSSTAPQCDGNEICFTGWASLVGQGRVSLSALAGYTFLWDFGDGEISTEAEVCHLYAGPDTYDVTLTVSHEDAEVPAVATGSVTVWANPTANFNAVPASGVAPLTVQFNDTSTVGSPNGGAIIDWDWDFGDLGTSDSQNPSHEYASAGTYAVILMVTDEHGCTDSDTATVTVTPRPELSIDKTADKSTANIGDVINYTITVENTGDLTLTNVRVQDGKLGIDETIDSLAPGATAEVTGTYGPVTEDDLPGPIHNVATATSNETPDPVDDEWDVTLITGPAIQVVKTADKSIAMVGEPIKYTYVVTNLGDVTLTDVTVTDDMLGSITLGSTTLATGASTSGVATYIVVVGDLPGPLPATLVNVATASGKPPVGPNVTDDDDASVLVVEPEAPPALLSIEKTGDVGPLSVGDTIKYTIKVINSGDAVLTNVVVNDAKLGIIDLNIGDLDPGDTYEITASYGPLEESDVGFVDNTASASSDQTDPVQDSWRVQVVETEQPAETPTPVPTPTPIPCIRSDIDVIVYGKIPVDVDMYVAGDLYHSKQTAVNAFGEQQATFSIWPGENEVWDVSITPRLPGYLDPDEWTFQLIKGSLSMRIPRCVHREVILQLLHSGAVPTPAPTLPVEELPVTGVPLPASSLGGTLLKLLGFLLIGSGGLFYWTSRRD